MSERSDEVVDLLILFVNGTDLVVTDVEDFYYNEDTKMFAYKKDGWKSFVPREAVLYFGRTRDYHESEGE